MHNTLVIGILQYGSANAALDNLAEADFDHISVIMKDSSMARKLADDAGPLRGKNVVTMKQVLKKCGISNATIAAITNALQNESVLIAFQTIPQSVDAAKEILSDAKATMIQTT